jgi:hypothetical protein
MKSEFDQAINDCTEALRLDHKNEAAYFIRRWSYSQVRNPAQVTVSVRLAG